MGSRGYAGVLANPGAIGKGRIEGRPEPELGAQQRAFRAGRAPPKSKAVDPRCLGNGARFGTVKGGRRKMALEKSRAILAAG